MFNIGGEELALIFLVVLLLFGAKRIPEVARSLGKGIAEIRDAMSGVERELRGEDPNRVSDVGARVRPESIDSIPRPAASVPAAAKSNEEPLGSAGSQGSEELARDMPKDACGASDGNTNG